MRFKDSIRASSSLAVLAMIALAGHAAAQEAPAAPLAEEEEPATVDQIIVTAQKREQSLQDVPVVVTALSEEVLEGAGVRDIKDMQILTPGLIVTSTSSEASTTARIRGVGTVGDNPGLESSVGVVVDGVYRPRNGVGFGDLGQVQRIEVLKGPQGTLFGKNTSAGVINIITESPQFNFGAEGELTAGNYGALGAAASVTGPLSDSIAARLYVARRQRDGFYEVRTGAGPRTLKEDQDQDFWTIRGQLLFTPTDDFSLRIIADHTERSENCCAAVQVRTGPTGPLVDAFAADEGVRNPARPFDRVAYSNRDTTQDITDSGISAQADVDLNRWGDATLTWIGAIRNWELIQGQDLDFTSADIWYRPADGSTATIFDYVSHEVRLAGSTERLNWLVGAFFTNEDIESRQRVAFGTAYEPYWSQVVISNLLSIANRPTAQEGLGMSLPPTFAANGTNFFNEANGPVPPGQGYAPGGGTRDEFRQDSRSLAVFTNNSFRVTDQLEFTLGLRYTAEEKELSARYTGGSTQCGAMLANPSATAAALIARGVPAADPRLTPLVQIATLLACTPPSSNILFNNRNTHQERKDTEWGGTLKAAYRFNDDAMVYASYARGYKGGGFNLDRTQSSNGLPTGSNGVVPITDTSFPAEFIDSYELGAKTTWLANTLLLNATLFHQTYENFQLNTFLGTSFVVESIPEVVSKGVDADMLWFTPIQGLTAQAGVTYADTTISNFSRTDLPSSPDPIRFAPLILLPGNTLGFAPKWSVTGSLNYEREIGSNLRGVFNLSAKYLSEYNTGSDLSPFKVQDAYGLVNGRIGFGSADERWTVELWGQNLTDTEYYQVVFNGPLQGSFIPTLRTVYEPQADTVTYDAFLGQPRTYGVTLRVKY